MVSSWTLEAWSRAEVLLGLKTPARTSDKISVPAIVPLQGSKELNITFPDNSGKAGPGKLGSQQRSRL